MRVLVAEDARSLADRVAEGLRDQGMAVDIARDGLEAAAKLDVNAYDVVLLDRDLPGIHGDDFCQMITSRDQRVMVLMLTAAGYPRSGSAAWAWAPTTTWPSRSTFPSSCFVSAPSPPPARRPRPCPRTAGIELDPAVRTATRDGRPLDLSVKEFAVLEVLLHASPAFLSAEDLLEKAWDEQADSSPPPSPSPSAACDANSATRLSSPPPQASGTASPAR